MKIKTVLLLISILSSFVINAQDLDTIKNWSSINRLEWADFRGKVPLSEIKSNVMAVCPHEIVVSPFRENGVLNYRVEVIFFKNQAWAKDTSSYVLTHEQLHFDIAELYARKLRKSISEVARRSASIADYKVVIEDLLLKENEEQEQYDRDTAHGIYETHQSEWLKKIAKELDALKKYASDK